MYKNEIKDLFGDVANCLTVLGNIKGNFSGIQRNSTTPRDAVLGG